VASTRAKRGFIVVGSGRFLKSNRDSTLEKLVAEYARTPGAGLMEKLWYLEKPYLKNKPTAVGQTGHRR
jgi:superfamily I DNA and/or RNA helicase